MLLISLFLVGVKLLSEENIPVLSKLSPFLLLLDDFTLDMDRALTLTLFTGGLVGSHWVSANAMSHTSTITSWTEEVVGATTTCACQGREIGAVCLCLEGVISHTEAGSWREWSVHNSHSSGTHSTYRLYKLFPLLDIITLETSNWDTVACDIFIHDSIIISISRLRYLLG
jgi:hypothetical protein